MDQNQQRDMDSNGYSESMTRPYYPTEVSEQEPMVTASAHTHNGSCNGAHFPGGEVPISQSGVAFNQNHSAYLATMPEAFHKGYPYSGNILAQGTLSGYESTVSTLQQNPQPNSQDRRMSDSIQAEDQRVLPPWPRYSDPVFRNGWNATWRPMESPGHVPASFSGASNAPYQASSSVCPNCRHYPHVVGDIVYQADQGDVSPTMEWGFLEANSYLPQPPEENFPSNQQFSTQNSRYTTSDNEHFDASSSEQLTSGYSLRIPAAVNPINTPVTVGAGDHRANKGLPKKRKRKPRPAKPRKPRALTVEGKAHAKAVREFPGGACDDCKRKKTKARCLSKRNLVSTSL